LPSDALRCWIGDTVSPRIWERVRENEFVDRSVALVARAFISSGDICKATGPLSLVLLAFYATSFTTALQRVFRRMWRRPPGGRVTDRLHGPAWLGGIIAIATLVGGLRRVLGGGPGAAAFLAVSTALAVGHWWVTGWLTLEGQVRWRALVSHGPGHRSRTVGPCLLGLPVDATHGRQ
jgi:hypothetical protein